MTQEELALAALERVAQAIRGGQLRVYHVNLNDPPGPGELVVRWERVSRCTGPPCGHAGPVVEVTDADDPPGVRRFACPECGSEWTEGG